MDIALTFYIFIKFRVNTILYHNSVYAHYTFAEKSDMMMASNGNKISPGTMQRDKKTLINRINKTNRIFFSRLNIINVAIEDLTINLESQ